MSIVYIATFTNSKQSSKVLSPPGAAAYSYGSEQCKNNKDSDPFGLFHRPSPFFPFLLSKEFFEFRKWMLCLSLHLLDFFR